MFILNTEVLKNKTEAREPINIPKDFEIESLSVNWNDARIENVMIEDFDKDLALCITPKHNTNDIITIHTGQQDICLKITEVCVHWLDDISIKDIKNEGYPQNDIFREIAYEKSLTELNNNLWSKNIHDKELAEHYNNLLKIHYAKQMELTKTVFEWFENEWNQSAPDGFKTEDNPLVFAYKFDVLTKQTISSSGEEELSPND